MSALPLSRSIRPNSVGSDTVSSTRSQDFSPRSGLDLSRRGSPPLKFEHSLLNGHQSFFGYITSSAAPVGALADFLASAVNPNVGSFQLAPVATEIEAQTVRWIAELIGFPADCGGLLLSGGNMANFVCFLAARAANAGWDVR